MVLAATVSLTVASACTSTTGPASDVPSTPSATADPSDPERSEPTQAPRARAQALSIAFAGDIHFEGALREVLDDPTAPILGSATSALASADLAVVNLETSIGSGGQPEPGKRFAFQAPPRAFEVLADAGIDVATMANNHALDFGRRPLAGMFRAARAAAISRPPLTVVGIGRNAAEAFEPARTRVRGVEVATIGATVADEDPTADPTGQWAATRRSAGTADAVDPRRLIRAVTTANRTADVVVVYLHWGVQGERCPSSLQRSLAKALVRAGADIVVGSHAHQLQGDGRLGPGYIAYGLGNYAWYSQSQATATTGVLVLTVTPTTRARSHADVTEARWTPARIGPRGLPQTVSGPASDRFDANRLVLRECAGLDP